MRRWGSSRGSKRTGWFVANLQHRATTPRSRNADWSRFVDLCGVGGRVGGVGAKRGRKTRYSTNQQPQSTTAEREGQNYLDKCIAPPWACDVPSSTHRSLHTMSSSSPATSKALAVAAAGGAAATLLALWARSTLSSAATTGSGRDSDDGIAPSDPPVPLDLRLGLTTPIGNRQVRWCVLGTGRVAHDFVQALKSVEGAVLSVVAARAPSRLASAQKFAETHGVASAVGTYAEALARNDVDIVYLSAVHQ